MIQGVSSENFCDCNLCLQRLLFVKSSCGKVLHMILGHISILKEDFFKIVYFMSPLSSEAYSKRIKCWLPAQQSFVVGQV